MFERCLKTKMPVTSVEVIANSKFATAQSSIRPKPQKHRLTLILSVIERIKRTHARTAATAAPTMDERDTYLDFLRVIPNAKKLTKKSAQLVEIAKPA